VVRAKTTRSHKALHKRNSGAERGIEQFKGSKDSAKKFFFGLGVWIFYE